MALNINNLAQLVKFSKHLVPSQCGEDAKSAKAELHMYEDSETLPRLHLSYRAVHFVSLKSEAEVKQAEALGYLVTKTDTGTDEQRWHCYVQETRTSHLWFCNFRRYAWQFTEDAKGMEYYCVGITYANGPAIYHLAETPEELVRDALVHAWSKALGTEVLPSFFDEPEVHALLKKLLEDAIEHITSHATPRKVPKGFEQVAVAIFTESPDAKAQAREKLRKQQEELAKESLRISKELERLSQ